MYSRNLIIITCCLCFCTINTFNVEAQMVELWSSTFDGSGNAIDRPAAMGMDATGNIYVTGRTDNNSFSTDIVTIKYDSSGVELWNQIYNGSANGQDAPANLVVDNSGNVYITGEVYNGSYNEYLTIKYNTNGVLQWDQTYDGPGIGNRAYDITLGDSGFIYVTGSSANGNDLDIATVKYDSNGTEMWAQTYAGPGNRYDEATSIKVDDNGNVYVTGSSGDMLSSDGTTVTIKYSPSGVQQWVNLYSQLNYWSESFRVEVDGPGNVIVVGFRTLGWGGEAIVIKYNTDGIQQWIRYYSGKSSLQYSPRAVVTNSFGDIYITGFNIDSSDYEQYETIKYDSNGTMQWAQIYTTGPGYENPTDITLDENGNIYVTGNDLYDLITLKYDTSGAEQWVERYPGIWNGSGGNEVEVYGNSVYITGESMNNSIDIVTVKYGLAIVSSIGQDPNFGKLRISPNPAVGPVSVQYTANTKSVIQLIIRDITGKEILHISEEIERKYFSKNINVDGYAKGVYIIQVVTNGEVHTGKIIVN